MAFEKSLTTGPDLWPEDFPSDPTNESVNISALQGNDTVTGTNFDDTLYGNENNDSLDGGSGNDLIYGGQGDDTVLGNSGNDVLYGNKENDYIEGGVGDDTIYGGQGDDVVIGGAGNDYIEGNKENDGLDGGEGDDYVHGGQGDDIVIGGVGKDSVFGGKENDILVIDSGEVESGEFYGGGIGDDTLYIAGDEDISSATINDIENILLGEGVTLTITLAQLTAQTNTEDGTGAVSNIAVDGSKATLKILASAQQIISSGILDAVGENILVLDQDGNLVSPVITGTEGDDTLTGTAGLELINALGGNDTTFGQGGDDTILGGAGNDQLWGGAGVDDLQGEAGDDIFGLQAAGEAVTGESYDGGDGTDTLFVGASNDVSGVTLTSIENFSLADGVTLTASLAQVEDVEAITVATEGDTAILKINATGAEIIASGILEKVGEGITVEGTDGPVEQGKDIEGTSGADLISPEVDDPLKTTDFADTVDGLGGDDTIFGAAGDDILEGGAGNDQVWGGAGLDNVSGGEGDDFLGLEAGDAVTGEIYDGGEGEDALLVTGDNDISGATVANVEAVSLGDDVTLTANLDQVTGLNISLAEGATQATLKILASAEEILASGLFDFDRVGEGVVVVDENGEVVNPVNEVEGTEGDDLFNLAGTAVTPDFETTNYADLVNALGGNDTILSAGGNDTVLGGEGDDSIIGGAGVDSIEGGAGDDIFGLASEGDAVDGETYAGGEGTDTLLVNASNDVSGATITSVENVSLGEDATLTVELNQVDASSDVTTIGLAGDATTATLKINATAEEILASDLFTNRDKVAEGVKIVDEEGNEVVIPFTTITGTSRGDDIFPESSNPDFRTTDERDLVDALGGDDTVESADGDDTVYGGTGNDLITGGAGADYLEGNQGQDLFIAEAGDVAEGEVIDGGTERDTLSIRGDNDLSVATLRNVEVLDVLTGVTVTLSSANLGEVVTPPEEEEPTPPEGIAAQEDGETTPLEFILGNGTVVLKDQAAIDTYNQLVEDGTLFVADTVEVQDADGNVIKARAGDPGTDPDKERPIAAEFTTGEDNLIAAGRFNAGLANSEIGVVPTLESGDTAQGTSDNDVLTAIYSTNSLIFANPPVQPTLRGIEAINITNLLGGGLGATVNNGIVELKSSLINGTNRFTVSDSNNEVEFTNIPRTPDVFQFLNGNPGASFEATVQDTTPGEANLVLESANAIDWADVFAVVGYETFNLKSIGNITNRVTRLDDAYIAGQNEDFVLGFAARVGGGDLTTINITGADAETPAGQNPEQTQDLVVPGSSVFQTGPFSALAYPIPDNVTKIDASEFTGDLQLGSSLGGGAVRTATSATNNSIDVATSLGQSDLEYIGSQGDDNLYLGNYFDDDDTLQGNEGSDTVYAIFNATVPNTLNSEGFENFVIRTQGTNGLIPDLINGLNPIQVSFNDVKDLETITIQEAGSPDYLILNGLLTVPTVIFEGDGSAVHSMDRLRVDSAAAATSPLNVEINNNGRGGVHNFAALTVNNIKEVNVTVEDGDVNGIPFGPGIDLRRGGIFGSALEVLTFTSPDDVQIQRIVNRLQPDSLDPEQADTSKRISEIDATAVEGSFISQSPSMAPSAVVRLAQGDSTFNAFEVDDSGTPLDSSDDQRFDSGENPVEQLDQVNVLNYDLDDFEDDGVIFNYINRGRVGVEIIGGPGNDSIGGTIAQDTLEGGFGSDTLEAGDTDSLIGFFDTNGNDVLEQDEFFNAGPYPELPSVHTGDNLIDSFITGVLVRDTFVYNTREESVLPTGYDVILNYRANTGLNGGAQADPLFVSQSDIIDVPNEITLPEGGVVIDAITQDNIGFGTVNNPDNKYYIGSIAAISEGQIRTAIQNAVNATNQINLFEPNTILVFTTPATLGTDVNPDQVTSTGIIVNDGREGFQQATDSVILLEGFDITQGDNMILFG
jgi:Ca2+-binding RTX toxin-like protein